MADNAKEPETAVPDDSLGNAVGDVPDGMPEYQADGTPEGAPERAPERASEGASEGASREAPDRTANGGVNNDQKFVPKAYKEIELEYYEEGSPVSVSGTGENLEPVPLSPFEKIKLETDRHTAHGHPVILPTEYGGFGPIYDIFVLFQNGIKRQLLVAYNMLEALIRYKYAVSKAEVRRFFDWFDILSDAVLTFLSIEETELFPFLEANGATLPFQLTKLERLKTKDKMAVLLETLDKQRDMFRLLPPGEVIPRITKILPDFFWLLVDYYEIQATNLPKPILDLAIDTGRVAGLRTRVMKSLKGRANFGVYVIFMSHWLRGAKLREFKQNFLGPMGTFRFEQWTKKFVAQYQSVPSKIINKLMAETAAGDAQDGSSSNLSFYLNKKKNAYNV